MTDEQKRSLVSGSAGSSHSWLPNQQEAMKTDEPAVQANRLVTPLAVRERSRSASRARTETPGSNPNEWISAQILQNPDFLVQGILMAEILNKPLALRSPGAWGRKGGR